MSSLFRNLTSSEPPSVCLARELTRTRVRACAGLCQGRQHGARARQAFLNVPLRKRCEQDKDRMGRESSGYFKHIGSKILDKQHNWLRQLISVTASRKSEITFLCTSKHENNSVIWASHVSGVQFSQIYPCRNT